MKTKKSLNRKIQKIKKRNINKNKDSFCLIFKRK